MNEITRRKLNATETIIKNIPAFIEAFVTFYGEEERENITHKFNNMLVIGYSQPEKISSIIRESNNDKNDEIVNEFFSQTIDKLEVSDVEKKEMKTKLKNLFFKDYTFENYINQPIYKYIKYKKGLSISEYEKKQIVNFLQQIHPETTIDNLDELIKKETFKSIDTIIPTYIDALNNYKKYEEETKPYTDYVYKCSELKTQLNKKYNKLLAEELKDLFTEEEFSIIEEKMNDKYFSSIQSINGKTKNYTAYYLNGTPLIEAFNQTNEKLLQTGSTWKKDSIKKDRIQYFKNFGLDLGNDYETYLNDPRTKELIPSEELIERIKNTHNNLYTKMMNEYYTSLSDYQKNRARINELELLDKEDGYNANAYERRGTCVSTNLKLVNGQYIEYPLFLIYIGNNQEYIDHDIIHELNHVYELTLQSVENNEYRMCCGWDILHGTVSNRQEKTVSLEDRKEKRKYELFNEIINELIAQEICEIMSQSGFYIFNTKENKKITGSTSYEKTKFLVKNFYETYKKEIIESRKNGNIEILYETVGKENFDELNQLFHEYYENFNIGFGMLKVYEDLEKNVETELTKKFKDLIVRKNNILSKMEEHNISKSQTR